MGVEDQDSKSPDESALEDEVLDAADAGEGTDGSESSTEQQDEDADLLSVARAAVQDGETASSAEGAGDEEGEDADKDEPSEEPSQQAVEPDNENFSDVPFHKHPRFQQLISERNALRQDAERSRNIDTFLTNNGLEANEAADLLVIGGLMKTNPAEAWKRALPTIQKLAVASGAVLPPDLADRVKRGDMPREAAIEVSRARAQATSMQASQQFSADLQQRQTQENARKAVGSAVTAWEHRRRTSDPDFEALYDDFRTELDARFFRNGIPSDPASAERLLDEVYGAVTTRRKKMTAAERKPAKKPVTGGRVAGNPRPEPRTLMEAAMQGLGKG